MKKIIALLLVAVMSAFCLFSCADDESTSENPGDGYDFDFGLGEYDDDGDTTDDTPVIPCPQ